MSLCGHAPSFLSASSGVERLVGPAGVSLTCKLAVKPHCGERGSTPVAPRSFLVAFVSPQRLPRPTQPRPRAPAAAVAAPRAARSGHRPPRAWPPPHRAWLRPPPPCCGRWTGWHQGGGPHPGEAAARPAPGPFLLFISHVRCYLASLILSFFPKLLKNPSFDLHRQSECIHFHDIVHKEKGRRRQRPAWARSARRTHWPGRAVGTPQERLHNFVNLTALLHFRDRNPRFNNFSPRLRRLRCCIMFEPSTKAVGGCGWPPRPWGSASSLGETHSRETHVFHVRHTLHATL